MPDILDPANSSRGDRPLGVNEAHGRPSVDLAPQPSLGARPPTISASQPIPLLHFQHVSKWYGPVIGVNQITLELRPGITGLVGSNGAGKSTLMRLATGHLRPDIGSVRVLGHDAWTGAAKRHVGYCPEVDTFFEEM